MTSAILQNAFLPTQISGCQLWLDAADTTTYTSSSSVTSWTNKGTAGGTCSRTNGTFNSTSATINSVRAMALSSGASMTVPTLTFGTTSRSIFLVPNIGAASGTQYTYIMGSTLVDLQCYSWSGAPDLELNRPGSNRLVVSSPTNYFNSSSIVSITSGININGNAQTLVTNNGNSFNSGSTTTQTVGDTATAAYNLGEIIIFDGLLTTEQRQQIEGYLAAKWGLQTSLPSNHPYRYSAYFTNQAYVSTIVSPTVTNRFTNASFLPTTIPGCKLWVDGADPAGTGVIPANGATISTWVDKSGTANNMSLTSGTVTYNSSTKAVNFPNGGNGIMTSANSTTFTLNQSVVFVVCEVTGSGYVFACPNITPYGGSLGDYAIRFGGTTTLISLNSNDLGFGTAYYVNGTLGVPSGGVITIPATPNIIYGLFNTTGNSTFTLSSSFGGRYFIGNIQEVLVYTGPITTAQRQQVEGYLAWKWRLQANLPSNHPYKNTSAVFATQPTTLAVLGANPYNNTLVFRYFNPMSIAGSVLWLDGKDTSPASMTLVGRTVKVWKDKSGNGYNATEGNASYPATSVGLGVLFPVSSTYFALSSPFASTHTVFIVATTSSASQIYLFGRPFPGGGPTILLNYVGVSLEYYDNASSGRQTLATTPTSTFIASYIRTFNTSVVGRYNGSQSFTEAGPSSEASYLAWGSLGCSAPAYGNWYTGTIYEFIIYNASLTTSQSQQVEGYLAWKWGIQANLPPTHPYKNYPPSP